MIVETIWQLRGNYCIVRCQRRRVNLSWVKMILSSLSLFLCTHRQQVPERNQKKKKKMKWRAERSASSHRFHCAILWPPSSCLLFIIHTHPHTFGCPERNSQQSLTSGAQKWGMGVGGGGVGGLMGQRDEKRSDCEMLDWCLLTMPLNECYAISPQLFMFPFKGLIFLPLYPTQNYSVTELFLNQV